MPPKEDDDIDVNEGLEAPSKPTCLEVGDYEATSATLKWKAPEKDGGAPIKEYLLEFKVAKPDGEWTESNGEPVKPQKFLNGTVGELTTNTKYEFRVTAVNRVGKSEASDATAPQLIKAQKAPPKIDRKILKEEMTFKVNQQVVLEVPCEGVPEPEMSWRLNDAEVTTADNVKVKCASGVAKLMFIPGKRSNTGKYSLTAKNKWGEDTAEVQINIFGKPEAPRGPLKVSEVTKKTCLLEWGCPGDNGGHPITHYEVEKMDVSTEQWLPIKSVKGLSLQVTNLVEGKKYQFLVRACNDAGDSPDLENEEVITAKNPFDPPGAPSKPNVSDWGEDFAELKWSADADGAEVTEYRVEVRNRDKRAWHQGPTVRETTCRVQAENLIQAGNDYEFRVYALNKGGESPASPVSTAITAKNRFVKPRINKDVLSVDRTVHAGQTFKVELEVAAEPKPELVVGFPEGSAASGSERTSTEVDVEFGTATFVLKNVTRADAGNYNVVIKNSQGYDEVEVRLNVLAPPSAPLGPLEVSGVTPNSCKLSWKKPSDDGGSAITSYSLERKELDRDVWVGCGKLTGKTVQVMKFLELGVSDLLPFGCYMFRVCAINAQGEGEALMSVMPCVAKHAVDPPLQPATPNVTDWDRKWAMLEWWAPQESDIKHYIVEKREVFLVPKEEPESVPGGGDAGEGGGEEESSPEEQAQSAAVAALIAGAQAAAAKSGPSFTGEYLEYNSGWMVAMITEDASPEVKLTDLSEGNRYQFRIKAVNAAGPSEPSEETEEITCKVRKMKPMIQRDSLKAVSVSAGQTIVLSAKCTGEPPPAKAFFYGRIEIKPCGSVDVQEKEHSLKATMLGARRDDTGVYTLRAENEHGSDTADVDVLVTDVPAKPHGPLKIGEVYGEGATVEWGPPEDDGGTPVTHYLLEKLEGAKTEWVACGKTAGDCLKCNVVGLTCGKEYRIQVSAVNAEGISEPLGGVDSFLTENPFGPPGAPGKPECVGVDSDHFDMKWAPPRNNGGSPIVGYQLETRLWKDNAYFAAGEVRYNLEFGEAGGSFLQLDQAYAVRVRAVNAAGPGPWSLDSEQCVCRHKSLKPKVTIKSTEKEVTLKAGETLAFWAEVRGEPMCEDVVWSLNGNSLLEGNGVSYDNSKPYKSFVQKEGLSRKDAGVLECAASNSNGKASAKVTINVVGKPSIPEDRLLVSNIHRSGCRLTWGASKDDGGLPVEYVIEKFVVAADAWAKLAAVSGMAFEVNDLETGREYAFQVRAVNAEGESEALPTAKTMVAKDAYTVPLPPMAPEVVDWSERHMRLSWKEPIDDGGAAITGYHVEAKARGDEEWQLWDAVDTNRTVAEMQKLQKGKEYQFRLIAINKAGKSEPSSPSRIKEAKARHLAPYMESKSLRDVTLVFGDRVKFDVPIFGEPAPEVTWTFEAPESEPVEVSSTPDRNVVVTSDESHAKLVINSLTKKFAGKYSLSLRNESGSDSAKVEVKVLDRPAAPEGLTATVEGTTCALLWKKSKDDGGAPIVHYQVERYDSERGAWMAVGKSSANDNTFKSLGLLPGRDYKFRVSAVNEHGDSDPAEAKDTVVATQDTQDSSVRNY